MGPCVKGREGGCTLIYFSYLLYNLKQKLLALNTDLSTKEKCSPEELWL